MKRCLIFTSHLSLLFLLACQASFTISPRSLPKQLNDTHAIELKTSDYSIYRLPDIYQKHVATVITFFQIGCPCVTRYQKRIQELHDQYSKHGIAFYYISSNRNDSFSDVQIAYNNRSIALPLLRDERGLLAKTLGAKGTPATAIINQAGQMIFLGWIDNERNVNETGRIAYLENAIVDVINGRAVTTPTSPMFGCPIR